MNSVVWCVVIVASLCLQFGIFAAIMTISSFHVWIYYMSIICLVITTAWCYYRRNNRSPMNCQYDSVDEVDDHIEQTEHSICRICLRGNCSRQKTVEDSRAVHICGTVRNLYCVLCHFADHSKIFVICNIDQD